MVICVYVVVMMVGSPSMTYSPGIHNNNKNGCGHRHPRSDTHHPRIRIITSKASRLHTRRLRLKRIQRPFRAKARTHGAERAHGALLLHKRHSTSTTTAAAAAVTITTTTRAATATNGEVDAETHSLLYDVSRGGVIRVLDARAEGAVRLWLGEEHGREETACLCASRRHGIARLQSEGVRAPVEEAGEPALDLTDGG